MFCTLQEVKDSELQLQEQFWRLVKLFVFAGHMSEIFQTPTAMQILQSGRHTFAYRIRCVKIRHFPLVYHFIISRNSSLNYVLILLGIKIDVYHS